MIPDRVRVLGQLLMEALDEKYPPEPVRGHGITLAFTEDERDMHKRKYAELSINQDHWKAQAEQSARSLAEVHEELKLAQQDAETYRRQVAALLDELKQARAEEREACAQLVVSHYGYPASDPEQRGAYTNGSIRKLAEAIRNRGSP